MTDQVWIQAGAFGLLAFVIIWVAKFTFPKLVDNFRSESAEQRKQFAETLAAMSSLFHTERAADRNVILELVKSNNEWTSMLLQHHLETRAQLIAAREEPQT